MQYVQDIILSNIVSKFVDAEDNKTIGEYPTSVIKNSAIGIDYQGKSVIQRSGRSFLIRTQTSDYSLVGKIDKHHHTVLPGSLFGDEHMYHVSIDVGNGMLLNAYGIYTQRSEERGDIFYITRKLQLTSPNDTPTPFVCDVVVNKVLDFSGNRFSKSFTKNEKKFDLRFDRDTYQCESECFEISLTKYATMTHLKLSRKDRKLITRNDIDAVIDSLSIVLFEPIRNHVAVCRTYTETSSEIDIYSDSAVEDTAKHFRPNIEQIGIPEDYAPFLCSLIDNYREGTRESYYHMLKVISESSTLIQTRLLSLCAAIEAIVNMMEIDVGGADADSIDQIVSEINRYIRSTYIEKSQKTLVNRLTSAMDRVKQTNSASNRLKKLQQIGTITKKEFGTWNSLRNTFAHGSEVFNQNKYNSYSEAVQVLFDLAYKLISEYICFKKP